MNRLVDRLGVLLLQFSTSFEMCGAGSTLWSPVRQITENPQWVLFLFLVSVFFLTAESNKSSDRYRYEHDLGKCLGAIYCADMCALAYDILPFFFFRFSFFLFSLSPLTLLSVTVYRLGGGGGWED